MGDFDAEEVARAKGRRMPLFPGGKFTRHAGFVGSPELPEGEDVRVPPSSKGRSRVILPPGAPPIERAPERKIRLPSHRDDSPPRLPSPPKRAPGRVQTPRAAPGPSRRPPPPPIRAPSEPPALKEAAKPPPKLTPNLVQRIRLLVFRGEADEEIAKRLGIPESWVRDAMDQSELA